MVVALLLIIAGVLLSFTGIGALIGIPMILVGLVAMVIAAFSGGRSRQTSSLSIDPSYASSERRPAWVVILVIVALMFIAYSMKAHAAEGAEKMPYGSRVGMELTIISADGLGTDHAEIHAVHERSDAAKFCREYENDKSTRCIIKETQAIPSFTYAGNCETGVFSAVGGKYRFVGRARPPSDPLAMDPAFQIISLESGEDLDGSEASGYPQVVEVFKHLCPARAPGNVWLSE